jgi:hypothetical protein
LPCAVNPAIVKVGKNNAVEHEANYRRLQDIVTSKIGEFLRAGQQMESLGSMEKAERELKYPSSKYQ